MDVGNGTWMALCALAFVLGLKHGLDADHLATIDGLTRCNAKDNPRLARMAGTLFSLGHGAVVILAAAVAGSFAADWRAPEWLEVVGATVSVFFLFGLAFINVRAVLVTDSRAVVAPAGLKGRLLGKYLNVHRAWAVAAVGALFALSFDTMSQAALFALAAAHFGGAMDAVLVAGLFVAGMLLVDGINGLWISRMIRRADRTAAVASRVMALAIAGISLAVGTFTIVRIVAPAANVWAEGRELVFGASVLALTATAFLVSLLAARLRRRAVDPFNTASRTARLS